MAYHNLNTGDLREQRRQQRRQEVSAPVGQTGIGHGDGLRIYDEGNVTIDGEDNKIILQIFDRQAHITLHPMNRAGLRANPAFWASETVFTVAGPLRTESRAASGFGGSNLFLYANHVSLTAGAGSANPGWVRAYDDGMAASGNDNGTIVVWPDGAIDLFGQRDATAKLTADGWARLVTTAGELSLSPAGNVKLSGPGGSFSGNADGGWSVGDTDLAVIQGTTQRDVNVFGNAINLNANTKVSGNFDVNGSKNFLMDHPEREGWTIRYGSTESPVSGIECRGRVTLDDDGLALVEFPDHYRAIIKPDTDVDVHLSAYGPDPAWCELPTTEGTTVHGTPGTVVAWHAHAERIGGDFTVLEEGTTTPPEPVPADTPTAEPTPGPAPDSEETL